MLAQKPSPSAGPGALLPWGGGCPWLASAGWAGLDSALLGVSSCASFFWRVGWTQADDSSRGLQQGPDPPPLSTTSKCSARGSTAGLCGARGQQAAAHPGAFEATASMKGRAPPDTPLAPKDCLPIGQPIAPPPMHGLGLVHGPSLQPYIVKGFSFSFNQLLFSLLRSVPTDHSTLCLCLLLDRQQQTTHAGPWCEGSAVTRVRMCRFISVASHTGELCADIRGQVWFPAGANVKGRLLLACLCCAIEPLLN